MSSVLLTTGCLHFHTGSMPGEPQQATYASIGGVRVRYTDSGGSGPAVVLVHGFASALETWVTVQPALRDGFRVIALDLKGFGWTDRPEGDYSPAAQARLVEGLLDQLHVQRASIVAHSWGSSVALAFALEFPQRVDKLALYDAWIYDAQLPTFFRLARTPGVGEALFGAFYKERPADKIAGAFFDPRWITQPLVDDITQALERPGTVAAALAAVRGQRYHEVEGKYGSITVPTLLLWGREDAVTTLDMGERLAAQLPRATLRVYPRCGHFPMIEALHASNRDLRAFLESGR